MKINKKYMYIALVLFLFFILFINIPKKENMSLDKNYEALDSSYNELDLSDNVLNRMGEMDTSRISSLMANVSKNFI